MFNVFNNGLLEPVFSLGLNLSALFWCTHVIGCVEFGEIFTGIWESLSFDVSVDTVELCSLDFACSLMINLLWKTRYTHI